MASENKTADASTPEYGSARYLAEKVFGFSLPTFNRVVKRNADFPRAIQVSRKRLYKIADVKAWADSKAAPAA